jgi:CrcB protein
MRAKQNNMNLILVGIGGICGGLARFQLGRLMSQKSKMAFPIGTFVINITGALLLGLVTSMDAGKNIYLLLGDGFLGAYTTFSTFMYEGFNLFQENEKLNAFLYIIGSLVLGIIGCVIGFAIGESLVM